MTQLEETVGVTKMASYFKCLTLHIDVKQPLCKQGGVMRTNCLDCLDRTNAIQMYYAHKVLLEQVTASLRHLL